MTAHLFQAVNKHIGHLDQCERGLTAVATEPYKVGLSGFLKAPETAGHAMNLDSAGAEVKSPRLAPKTGAQTWGTGPGLLSIWHFSDEIPSTRHKLTTKY